MRSVPSARFSDGRTLMIPVMPSGKGIEPGFLPFVFMDAPRNVLTQLETKGAAVGHFNIADFPLLKAVVAAADEMNVPVFVGASDGERHFLGTRQIAALVKSLREEFITDRRVAAAICSRELKARDYDFAP